MADTNETQTDATTTPEPDAFEWAVVEVFGHRRHTGRIREEERFGAKMLRVDVPNEGNPEAKGWTTHWYGGASIFSLTLTDEATALRANKPYQPAGRYLPPPDDFDVVKDDDDQDDGTLPLDLGDDHG